MNNLYIINGVLSDYTYGMVVIAAPTLERCREIFVEEFGNSCSSSTINNLMIEYDYAIKSEDFKVIEAVNYPEGVVSHVYGGG